MMIPQAVLILVAVSRPILDVVTGLRPNRTIDVGYVFAYFVIALICLLDPSPEPNQRLWGFLFVAITVCWGAFVYFRHFRPKR